MNSLPKNVTRQRRDCDLNPGPSAPEPIDSATGLFNCACVKHFYHRESLTCALSVVAVAITKPDVRVRDKFNRSESIQPRIGTRVVSSAAVFRGIFTPPDHQCTAEIRRPGTHRVLHGSVAFSQAVFINTRTVLDVVGHCDSAVSMTGTFSAIDLLLSSRWLGSRRVYDSRHLQADCQEPGSAPEPYAR